MIQATNPCMTCRFAQWERTANGRLHPSGGGRCKWKMPEIALPKAMYFTSFHAGVPSPSGGYIDRKDNRECLAHEPADISEGA